MAAPAFLTRRRGLAVCRTAVTCSVTVVIAAVLSKSALRRARNPARGRSRRPSAICSSGSSSASRVPAGAAAFASWKSAASMASSSRSTRERSDMGSLHSRAEFLQRAELELLDGAFGLLQPARDFANAPFLHEPLDDHPALILRQLVHEPEEPPRRCGPRPDS